MLLTHFSWTYSLALPDRDFKADGSEVDSNENAEVSTTEDRSINKESNEPIQRVFTEAQNPTGRDDSNSREVLGVPNDSSREVNDRFLIVKPAANFEAKEDVSVDVKNQFPVTMKPQVNPIPMTGHAQQKRVKSVAKQSTLQVKTIMDSEEVGDRFDDAKLKQRAMKQIAQVRALASKPRASNKQIPMENVSLEVRDRVAVMKIASSMQVVRNRTTPAIQTLTRGKTLSRQHSFDFDDSLENSRGAPSKPAFRPRPVPVVSRIGRVQTPIVHSDEDISTEFRFGTSTPDAVSVTQQLAGSPAATESPLRAIFRHSDEQDDISLELRDRVPSAMAPTAVDGREDVSFEVVFDRVNQTATVVAVHSNERDDDSSLELRDRVVAAPEIPVTQFDDDDVSFEIVQFNQTATLVHSSNERDHDSSLEVVVPVAPVNQTETVLLSLHSDEDDGFSFEMIDGVLRRVVKNQTSRIDHHSAEGDFSAEIRAHLATAGRNVVPVPTRSSSPFGTEQIVILVLILIVLTFQHTSLWNC